VFEVQPGRRLVDALRETALALNLKCFLVFEIKGGQEIQLKPNKAQDKVVELGAEYVLRPYSLATLSST